MHSKLSTVTIPPTAEHRYSVLWLHGLGADGNDFAGIIPELHLAAAAHTHFIFPEAPIQAVTVNGGMKMRSWYDIYSLSITDKIDGEGIDQSSSQLDHLISAEIAKGIPANHILLAGFSQGGLIALHAGLRYPERLAGIVALSTYLPTLDRLPAEASPANAGLPIFMGHGILDAMIDIEFAKACHEGLKTLGYDVRWHDYLMEHAVCGEEIQHISAFINAIFMA